MATSTIKKITPSEFAVSTANAAINGQGATGWLNLRKWGKIVTMTGSLDNITSGTNLTLANVPVGYRPTAGTLISCGGYSGSQAAPRGEAEVQTNGNVVVSIESVHANLKIFGAWITS